jgi:2-iminoacetate synthase
MNFTDYSWNEISEQIYHCTENDIEHAIAKQRLNINDFMALVSPAAEKYLETMATPCSQTHIA